MNDLVVINGFAYLAEVMQDQSLLYNKFLI
jgi:hypothetical protein